MSTITITKEDADFIQEQFNLLTSKINELEEEIELYKSEYDPKPIDEVLNLEEVRKIFPIEEEAEENEEKAVTSWQG